jgi:hypothetical protein
LGKLDTFLKTVKSNLIEHSPEILTGLGIASMFGAVIFSIQATPKAKKAIEKKKKDESKDKLTVPEVIGTCWKYYIPTVLSFGAGTACIIGSSSIAKKRTAAIAAAYSITETALTEYKSKATEVIGEAKEQKIREKIADDRIRDNPPKSNEVIITNKGETLFYETISGRYFKSDIDRVRRAENELNRNMRSDVQISVNDLYMQLGLPITSSVNDDIGWDIEYGYIEFIFSAHMSEDDQPCIAIDYRKPPKPLNKIA